MMPLFSYVMNNEDNITGEQKTICHDSMLQPTRGILKVENTEFHLSKRVSLSVDLYFRSLFRKGNSKHYDSVLSVPIINCYIRDRLKS